jgi:hypothetical protein
MAGASATRPRRPSRVVRAGWGAAVALGASTAVLLFALLVAGTTWWNDRSAPPPAEPVATAAADVDLWVGDLSPGVKAVVASFSHDAAADRLQDARWNRGLGLDGADALTFYELVAFNTSDEPATVTFEPAALVAAPSPGAAPLASRDLAPLLARPLVASTAIASTLRALGADRASVSLPPGRVVRRPVAFPAGADLATAASVASRDGVAFHRRRIRRVEWAGILLSPSVDRIRAL